MSPQIESTAEPATCNLQPATHSNARYRRGRVARLPKELRSQVNQMLDDGVPYPQIVKNLNEHDKDLSNDCVRRWKKGGYQDYLREQRLAEQCRQRQDRAFDLIRQSHPINGFQAAQQLASAQICEAVADVGSDTLREALTTNPLNYFRMLNSFSRLTNGGLRCEKHLLEEAERKAALEKQIPSHQKGLSPEALKEIIKRLNLM